MCPRCERRRLVAVNVFVLALLAAGAAEAWQQNIPAKNSVRYGERKTEKK